MQKSNVTRSGIAEVKYRQTYRYPPCECSTERHDMHTTRSSYNTRSLRKASMHLIYGSLPLTFAWPSLTYADTPDTSTNSTSTLHTPSAQTANAFSLNTLYQSSALRISRHPSGPIDLTTQRERSFASESLWIPVMRVRATADVELGNLGDTLPAEGFWRPVAPADLPITLGSW